VPKALLKKGALQPPDFEFPRTMADLEEYTLTESGLYFLPVKTGKAEGAVPKKGDVIEIHYVGAVATVDDTGAYDVAEREGDPEIYPNLPQVRRGHVCARAVCVLMCVCVCVRARARACLHSYVCVCVCANSCRVREACASVLSHLISSALVDPSLPDSIAA
jgi:hypothetical protein